ncbi:hypothetical protein [Neobacillus piezotolerans]|uniref:hypothetical protein n=1 Tax=Neobacillus piezotolerans TaxID=2259171 RepID=UPI001FEAB83D|nr:hypothetical protein [Neobacillus piezotolerans]
MLKVTKDRVGARIRVVKGRRSFQLKVIRRSYRNRGKVPRNHRKIIEKIMIVGVEIMDSNRPVKIRVEIMLKSRIFEYSAKKIMAKEAPAYSTLKPETSSDSPSAKSKGLRLTSAVQIRIQISKRGIRPAKNGVEFCGI